MTENQPDDAEEARLALLRSRYPTAFPPESDAIARRSIRQAAKQEAILRGLPLENADAPSGIFTPTQVTRPELPR